MELCYRVQTIGLHGYSVKFSPFSSDLIAVAASENFGISGNGRLLIKTISGNPKCSVCEFSWTDGLFDISWSEIKSTCLASAAGDGSVQIWDMETIHTPVMVFREHKNEVSSVEWAPNSQGNCFATSSWDGSLKLWDIVSPKSVSTLLGHEKLVYHATWSPHLPATIASVSGDSTVRIWNAKSGATHKFVAHTGEVLACDWCKYNEFILATAGTDGEIRGWDIRQPQMPLYTMKGHRYPVKRLKFSPFDIDELVSVSYDFTTRLWNTANGCSQTLECHSEFVYGLDWSVHEDRLIADCAWDQNVAIYRRNYPTLESTKCS